MILEAKQSQACVTYLIARGLNVTTERQAEAWSLGSSVAYFITPGSYLSVKRDPAWGGLEVTGQFTGFENGAQVSRTILADEEGHEITLMAVLEHSGSALFLAIFDTAS